MGSINGMLLKDVDYVFVVDIVIVVVVVVVVVVIVDVVVGRQFFCSLRKRNPCKNNIIPVTTSVHFKK